MIVPTINQRRIAHTSNIVCAPYVIAGSLTPLVRQPTWKSKRAPRKRRCTNSLENPGDTGRIYGRARTGNFRGRRGTRKTAFVVVDVHRGTCKFIRRENTSSTIEKSPACNGRFSLIGSSGLLDETYSYTPIRGRIFVDFWDTVYIGDFFLTFAISLEKEKERGRGLLHAIVY